MYNLVTFCGVSIDYYQNVQNIGSGATPTAYQALMEGGALDMFGDRQKDPGVVERVKSMKIWADTQAELSDIYLTLLALRGKSGALVRRMANGDLHWQNARLVEVVATSAMLPLVQDVDLRFETREATWRGEHHANQGAAGKWYLNTGKYLNSGLYFNGTLVSGSPSVINLTVGASTDAGRAPVRAVKVTAVAGDTPLTALSIVRTGGETLSWAGTLAAGKSLVIDAGICKVTNDGVGAYDELTFTPTADMAAWFTLQPGNNEITITATGGGIGLVVLFDYYEAWY